MKKFKRIAVDIILDVHKNELLSAAGILTYKVFFSLFPFIIFLSAVFGFVNLDLHEVSDSLAEILPQSAFETVMSVIATAANEKNTGLLSFSLILSIFGASSGFGTAMRAINTAYCNKDDRQFFIRLALRMSMVIIFACIIIISFLLLLFGDRIYEFLSQYYGTENDIAHFFFGSFRYILIFFILLLSVMLINAISLPKQLKRPFVRSARHIRNLWRGAVFCVGGWLVSCFLFNIYITNFSRMSLLYGSLGGVLVFMLWLNLICLVFLVGAEINAYFYLK